MNSFADGFHRFWQQTSMQFQTQLKLPITLSISNMLISNMLITKYHTPNCQTLYAYLKNKIQTTSPKAYNLKESIIEKLQLSTGTFSKYSGFQNIRWTFFANWWVFRHFCTTVSTQINVKLFNYSLIIFLTLNNHKMFHFTWYTGITIWIMTHNNHDSTQITLHTSLCSHFCSASRVNI